MSVTIRGGGSFQNPLKPWLTPQVLVDINLEDFEILASPSDSNVDITLAIIRYERVINAEIQLIYIAENQVSAHLEKVLATIAASVASDWNPSDRGSKAHMTSNSTAINPTNFQFGLQIDNTQEIRYISIWIQSQKLKVEYATQAFERVKAYVLSALSI